MAWNHTMAINIHTMPKIALVEPYDHSEVLYTLCELLLGHQAIKLCIFSQQYILDHAPTSISISPDTSWFTFEAKKRATFFKQNLSRLNDCDLIIWITAVAPYEWIFDVKLKPPLLLIVHNRNNWFAPLRHLSVDTDSSAGFFKDIVRLLRWLLVQRRRQQLLLQKVAAVGYGDRTILADALINGHCPTSGKAIWIPFTYLKHRPDRERPASEVIKIIIPGVVTDNGRDYYSVAMAMAMALPQIQRPVHLVLLGKAKSAKGLIELRQLENERFRLTIFSHWISQKDYGAYLRDADFLILPFRTWHKVGFVKEYWGRSGISGAVSDMVYYGLPALCSIFHSLNAELENWVKRYAGYEELAALLVEWVNERRFLEVKRTIQSYEGALQCDKAGSLLVEQLMNLVEKNTNLPGIR